MKIASQDIQFELAGAPYTLRFSAKALAALQDYWELENLDAVAVKLNEIEQGSLGTKDLSALLWASLRTHHPDVTIDQAFDILDEMGIQNFERLLTNAIQGASSPAAAGGSGGGTKKKSPGR